MLSAKAIATLELFTVEECDHLAVWNSVRPRTQGGVSKMSGYAPEWSLILMNTNYLLICRAKRR